ncbi:hypothetical protein A2U01_0047976 [Trifolium medium]|uniref:Uncharacterized protein n=1 Tax=Trifolium medium TaxID=97028 RepID=A0A392QS24_9FABA|nr:hypothetical protein [Trifolium medium]
MTIMAELIEVGGTNPTQGLHIIVGSWLRRIDQRSPISFGSTYSRTGDIKSPSALSTKKGSVMRTKRPRQHHRFRAAL